MGLDSALLSWFAVGPMARIAVRLTVAHALGRSEELASSLGSLSKAIAEASWQEDPACCLHPAVLEALRATLADSATSEAVLCSACFVLEHLLTLRRARQLFLPRQVGGVAALLAVYRRGGAPASLAQNVLEALCDSEGASENGETSAVAPKDVRRGEEEIELGECCVCLDRGKSHAFLPCGHLCACMECAAFLAARGAPCPIC